MCAAALWTGVTVAGQTTTSVLRPVVVQELTPEQIAAQRKSAQMSQEYWYGDADAAIAYFASQRTPGYTGDNSRVWNSLNPLEYPRALGGLLLGTEIGMYRRTFGKYASYAPIETVKEGVVGLNGAFELESFTTYQSLDDLLHRVRNEVVPRERDLLPRPRSDAARAQSSPAQVPAADRARVETFVREWHVITISHCARWQLNCATTLLASARERFPDSADVLMLGAVAAESQFEMTDAQALLRMAVRADPNHVAAQLRLGRLLLAQGRSTEAQPVLERALSLARTARHDASRALALESLAEIDRRAGRTTRARERAAEAASLALFASPLFAGLSPADIYRAGQFYEQPRRLAALRDLVRPPGPR